MNADKVLDSHKSVCRKWLSIDVKRDGWFTSIVDCAKKKEKKINVNILLICEWKKVNQCTFLGGR